ncbi:MAG: hypothetical protein J6E44_09405 [Lachnospiraceae bacterium]|nr:hypothetical protein [Lachnospiraceae bacterium]
MAVPENDSDLYRLPQDATDVFRRVLCGDAYASGRHFSMFTYEDGSMILYRYVKEGAHPEHVILHTAGKAAYLNDAMSGERIPLRERIRIEDFRTWTEYTADVVLEPGIFRKYRWEFRR